MVIRKILYSKNKKVQYILGFFLIFISIGMSADRIVPIIVDDITIVTLKPAPSVTVYYKDIEYKTIVSPYTGRIWLDRNIGASRVCMSVNDGACYGYYFQWGRSYDGHQLPTSNITNVLALDIYNAGSEFIVSDVNNNWDWTTKDNDGKLRSANWSKIDGTSVCPLGFRVPKIEELEAELFNANSADVENAQDALNSFLRLPLAGYRSGYSAQIFNKGSEVHILSTSPKSYIYIEKDLAYVGPYAGEYGYAGTIRCIKENNAN